MEITVDDLDGKFLVYLRDSFQHLVGHFLDVPSIVHRHRKAHDRLKGIRDLRVMEVKLPISGALDAFLQTRNPL